MTSHACPKCHGPVQHGFADKWKCDACNLWTNTLGATRAAEEAQRDSDVAWAPSGTGQTRIT